MSLDTPSIPVPVIRDRLGYKITKRVIDFVLAVILLIMLSPIFLIISLLIKLTSKGPIIFKQTRIGLGGKPFTFYKFRSMCVDAEKVREKLINLNEANGPIFKIKNDPRVTPVGRFLRRYSLDELPQFLNVIKGDMSFVGPRPPLPCEVKQYEDWHLKRLSVIPGITCLWQISGRSNLSFDEWVKLDLHYIETRSLWRDFVILIKTIPAVLLGKGAY